MSHASFADDPFKDIPPALLNSADIRAYAAHGAPGTRLFEPFHTDRVKSASYEIRFSGASYYQWAANSASRIDKTLGAGDELVIPSNGIVFVSPAVEFHLPPYLALRFNLAIRWVHRGLLLGTGPLVDPGFEGRLLIPVHNLTDEDVHIEADKGFMWVEVTKVSPWPPASSAHAHSYKQFDPKKKNLDVGQYFEKANKGAPIRSSIPTIALRADSAASTLRDEWATWRSDVETRVAKQMFRVTVAAWIGGATALVSIVGSCIAIVLSLQQLSEATKSLVMSSQQSISDARELNAEKFRILERKFEELQLKRSTAVVAPEQAPKPVKGSSGGAN